LNTTSRLVLIAGVSSHRQGAPERFISRSMARATMSRGPHP
jgi:hypothetical protein